MDVVYLLKNSIHQDREILFSLRSVAAHLRYIRKVWVFGDKPTFMSLSTRYCEHVPWTGYAERYHWHPDMKNFFQRCYLVAQHPGPSEEFLLFTDDYVILEPVAQDIICRNRYIQDFARFTGTRGSGKWRQALWRTMDRLKARGYPQFNFEAHTPMYITKQAITKAFTDLGHLSSEARDCDSDMLGPSTILNHRLHHEQIELTHLRHEGRKAGFYKEPPPNYSTIEAACQGKSLFNFDDKSFTEDMQRFLCDRFPEPCKYERRLSAVPA